jgi:enamine deaminase RidA (YjgF/YER057c/UK114 family)
MQTRIYSWLGKEFIEISGEARPGASVAAETEELFQRVENELARLELSLENIVRTRLWGRDREARTLGTAARSKILGDRAKAASSSFICQSRFDSDARVALDLLAMRPSRSDAERRAVEFKPPRNYLCYLRYESMVFCSGFTSEAYGLENQVPEVVRSVAAALAVAGTDWSKVAKLSLFLDRSQKLQALKELLASGSKLDVPQAEFAFVDGFAAERYLLEMEATAGAG